VVTPALSVVIATRDRPERLARQLASLRAQTTDRFEVIVVDDGSGPAVGELLAGEKKLPGLDLHVVRRETPGGPGAGRNSGWRLARAPLVAFTDDDCEVAPGWVEAYLAAAAEHPGSFLQGKVLPLPAEEPSYGPFSHTIRIEELTRGFETANILYPKALLEQLGGFDEIVFTRSGEDTDLAWRAMATGAEPVFVEDALAYHAVIALGPRGHLQRAARWHEAPLVYRRHPGLRRTLVHRLFWSREHAWAFRALLALLLPRKLWWIRWWLAAPYVVHLTARRSGPLLAPYLILHDATEIATLARGSIKHRTLVL
jgi:GT2 family glycosyltransferase